MRASAKVDELTLTVEAENAELMQLVVDMFHFKGLPKVSHKTSGLLDGQRESFEGLCVLDDLRHLGFDFRKVAFRQRPLGYVDVVIEARCCGGTKGEFGSWKEPEYRPCHDMGGGMSQDVERFPVFLSQQSKLDGVLAVPGDRFHKWSVEIDHTPIDHRGDRRLRQSWTYLGGDIDRSDRILVFLDRSVGQSDGNHQ